MRLFERLDPARTAAVYIDMQVTFLAPGAPVEVPMARAIVPRINALNARLRALGVRIYWVAHANTSRDGASDWPGFFDHFVTDEARERTMAGLAPGGRRPANLARIGGRRRRHDPLQEPLQRPDRGLLVAGDDGARPRHRHAAHRRHQDRRLLRIDRARRHDAGLQNGHARRLLRRPHRRRAPQRAGDHHPAVRRRDDLGRGRRWPSESG